MTEQMPLIADIADGAAHRQTNRRYNGMQQQQSHAEIDRDCGRLAPATARWTA
jgi:hypothetical protein